MTRTGVEMPRFCNASRTSRPLSPPASRRSSTMTSQPRRARRTAPSASAAAPKPCAALFVSRQQLLAETVGRVVARDGQWSIGVLDRDHPHLPRLAVAAEPVVVVVDVDDDVVPGLELISQLVRALPVA